MKKRWLTVLLAVLVMAGMVFTACPTEDDGGGGGKKIVYDEECDIIVVGAGVAGYSAAVGAKTAGTDYDPSAPVEYNELDVRLLEKRNGPGGVTNTTGGGMNGAVANADGQTYAQFRASWETTQHNNQTDPKVEGYLPVNPKYPQFARLYNSYKTARTMHNFLSARGIPLSGGGTTLVNNMANNVKTNMAIEAETNKRAVEILMENGKVTGVRYQVYDPPSGGIGMGTPTSTYKNIKAKKVILTTGGYSNLYETNRPLALELAGSTPAGGYFAGIAFQVDSTGDGIVMGRNIGAALYDESYAASWYSAVAPLLYDVTSSGGTNYGRAFSYVGSMQFQSPMLRAQQIVVGMDGKRFKPENNMNTSYTSNYAMYAKNKFPYWIIYSAETSADNVNIATTGTNNVPRSEAFEAALASSNPVHKAEVAKGATLADLADAMGMDAAGKAAFIAEVQEYDDLVRKHQLGAGDPGYLEWEDPLVTRSEIAYAGKPSTGTNLSRFATGPYYAVKYYPAGFDSMGGLVTNVNGQVLTKELPMMEENDDIIGAPYIIPNLYAAGATSNRFIISYYYGGGTSIASYKAIGGQVGRHAGEAVLAGE